VHQIRLSTSHGTRFLVLSKQGKDLTGNPPFSRGSSDKGCPISIFPDKRRDAMKLRDEYEESKELKKLLKGKFKLDCGHHVTLNHNLGNNIMVINGKELKIICSLCAY
jgi:hypothetical protein